MTDKHVETSEESQEQSAGSKWQQMAEEEQAVVDEQQEQMKEGMEQRSRESLENELVDLRLKFKESEDKALRIQAEMQNLRRRLEEDMKRRQKFAIEKLVQELLPVADSLTRGIEAVAEGDVAREGMELTASMLQDVLSKNGVQFIQPEVGEAFDPQKHEAMSMIPVEGAQTNTIVEVLQAGCELNGRVLKAAMVIVAR